MAAAALSGWAPRSFRELAEMRAMVMDVITITWAVLTASEAWRLWRSRR
jgi:hypothetical protein